MSTQVETKQESIVDPKECLANTAVEIFNMTCGIDLQRQESSESEVEDGVLMAVISVVGAVDWSIFLGLPRKTAETIAEKFAGFPIPYDSEDMGDAVGELTNILAGQVKANLDSHGIKAEISLPSVIRADNMKVLISRDTSTCKTCFNSQAGELWAGVVTGKSPTFMA